MYHRPYRVPELLENVKAEFEALAGELNMYKMQREDYERKLQAQMTELQTMQSTLYDLEIKHTKLKQQYEDEIMRLRAVTSNGQGPSPFPAKQSPQEAPVPTMRTDVPTLSQNFVQPFVNPSDRRANTPTQPTSGKRGRTMREENSGSFSYPSTLPGIPPMSENPPPKIHKPDGKSDSSNSFPTLPSIPFPSHPKETAPTNSRIQEQPIKEKEPKSSNRAAPPIEDKESDWIVNYNPNVQTDLKIDLGHTLEHMSVVCCVKFSHDGKYLATGCNRSAQIYDVETGDKLHTFSDDNAKEGDLYIRSVCFSPDGKLLAAGAEDKTVKIWDIEHKRIAHTCVGHELDIYSLDFSYDGSFIVSGSGDKKAKIWDVEKGKCLFTLGNDEIGPKDGVTSVAISPDGRLVAAGSLDRIVRLWDAQNGYFLERYEGHLDSVYSVAFSPDGKSLASGSLDKTLKIWDLSGARTRSRCRSTFNGHKDFVLSVAFSPDGNWLISGSKDRTVQFWDPRTSVTHMMLQGHKNSVISVAVSPTGNTFATGSGDCRARIWKYKPCFPAG